MREKVYTVAYMALVATVFTAVVAAVSQFSSERIELNQRLARQRLLMSVMGIDVPHDATLEEIASIYDEQVKETKHDIRVDGATAPILAGYSQDGALVAYAFQVRGRGLWGEMRGYLGVGPELDRITGVAFYEHSETPGLGGEVTKTWFVEQFRGLQIPNSIRRGQGRIRLVARGAEKSRHDVDAITGATQTSIGVEEAVNEGLIRFMQGMAPSEEGQ